MNVSNLLGVIVAALAILGAGGSAFAFLTDRGNKDRLVKLRADILDRNERIDFLEAETKRKAVTIAGQAKEIHTMHGELVSLKEYRDAQAGPLLALAEQLRTLHDLLKAHSDIATAGFALLEEQNVNQLRLLGDRRTMPDESVIRELGHD